MVQCASPLVEFLQFFQDFVFDLRRHEGKLLRVDVYRVRIVIEFFLNKEITRYININICDAALKQCVSV